MYVKAGRRTGGFASRNMFSGKVLFVKKLRVEGAHKLLHGPSEGIALMMDVAHEIIDVCSLFFASSATPVPSTRQSISYTYAKNTLHEGYFLVHRPHVGAV